MAHDAFFGAEVVTTSELCAQAGLLAMIRNMSMTSPRDGLPRWWALWLSDQDALGTLGFPCGQNTPNLRQATFSVFRRSGPSVS